ncbi:MAG: serine/threonine-protein kinase [Lachnospiraceae bacterium]|nr:serine/threonine-protein kinase [Lachnospiraceae bacterium]
MLGKIGRYRVVRKIGQGGSGSVYLVEDESIRKKWAMKCIPKQDEKQIREIHILKELDHPAIPRIVEQIDDGECIYVVMDYIKGMTLKETVEKRKSIPLRTRVEWAITLCDVLQYLHSQKPPVLYRDMKPGNVIITGKQEVKLVDFGAARVRTVQEKDTLGTKGYAAPEQYRGEYGIASDIFGMGATMRAMMPGERNRHWNRIIGKATAEDPDKRYVNCKFLKRDLERLLKEVKSQKRLRQILYMAMAGLAVVFTAQFVVEQVWQQRYLQAMQKEQYEDAILLYPEKEEGYLGLLRTCESRGTLQKGIDLVVAYEKEYREQLPSADRIFEQIAMYYLCGDVEYGNFQPDYEKAVEYFEQIHTYRSELMENYENLAKLLSLPSDRIAWEKVGQMLLRITEQETKDKSEKGVQWRQNIAGIYLTYEKELQKNEENPLETAQALLLENEHLLENLEQTPQVDTMQVQNLQSLAEIYRLQGKKTGKEQAVFYGKSLECYNRLLATPGQERRRNRYYMSAASLYRLLGQPDQARDCYEAALKKQTSLEVYCAYAWMELTECENAVKARTLYEQLAVLPEAANNANVWAIKARLEEMEQ